MDFTTRYKKLNASQQVAVDTIEGPVMVIAGPGTGKTELLSMRAANILRTTDTLPENILCLTFTDSGAAAMRERLVSIIGKDAYKVAIHTFHSFGTEVINQNRAHFYRGAEFRPADELSSYEIIRTLFDALDYRSPIASKMNGEYTYLNDTLRTISELKRGGLTPDELLAVLEVNDHAMNAAEPALTDIFAVGIKKNTAELIAPHLDDIRQADGEIEIPGITPLSRAIADSLQHAVVTSIEDASTKPITAWRNQWMQKDDHGQFVFKSRARQAKLRAVADVYRNYLNAMEQNGLYDFDDMILRVIQAIEKNPELRYNLQEKFQYLMVDEFQDTNMAQMRILHNLTDNPVNEGRPNILVVGDDDQAIYSFQGADIGNIVGFRDLYPAARIITLIDNYRSAPVVLEHAREVIRQGQDRLEHRIADLDKTLTPHHDADASRVELIETATLADERAWLVESIRQQIDAGVRPADIAVLARRHHEIVALLPYFADAGIRVNYERRDNVLDLDIIRHLELLSNTLIALYESRHDDANALLPELLAHPAWGISAINIWKLSLSAKNNRQTWMEVMATTPAFIPLHSWLVTSAQAIAHTPLEFMLDHLLGHEAAKENAALQPQLALASQQTTEIAATATSLSPRSGSPTLGDAFSHDDESTNTPFTSPLFGYFFSADKLAQAPDEYLTYLEALRTIRTKLREYQPDEEPRLQTFIGFIDLHRRLGSTITSLRPSVDHLDSAVNLMTAHKSKGLEFDTVYTIGAVDSAWGERVRAKSSLLAYPENLPLAPTGGNLDERLRLFFVAMTRAKRQLFLSYSRSDDNGKDTLRASFLTGDLWQANVWEREHTIDTLTRAAELQWYQPLVELEQGTMKELLQPVMDRYKLSATHIGAFLDVTHGGPQAFLLQQILRFPQAKGPHAAYGTAIHATLQRAHAHLAATGRHRAVEDILHDFENNLRDERLPEDDFQTFLQKGSDALQTFLEHKYIDFKPTEKPELDFSNQQSIVGQAHLTGKLDLVDIDTKTREIVVTDYKTGRASRDWKGKTDYDKIKLHKYRQQLMFYKLLVEHSRDWNNYTVTHGILQFVEPTQSGDVLALDATFSREELDEFTHLLQVIWRRITTLDLPDTSHYEQSYKGMLAFECDLLDEK